MRETVYQLMIFFRIIVCPFRQFLIHPFQLRLKLKYMFECQFCLSHHRPVVGKNHDLWQISDGYIFRSGYNAMCRRLQAG